MAAEVDHAALFAAVPTPCLVLGPDLVIVDVNRAYLETTGRTRDDLVGRHISQAFPDNAGDPDADGVGNMNASLRRVLATRRPDTMPLEKYDIPVPHRPGIFEERWWSLVNTPVLGPDGQVAWIIHRGEDVTAFVKAHQATRPAGVRVGEKLEAAESLEAELYARARELQRLNEELRQAHTREREVAVTLQEAMLHTPDLAHHSQDVVVRYQPAVGSLNVCGDWYDVVDIPRTSWRWPSAMSSAMACGPPRSWACCAAPCRRPYAPSRAPRRLWRCWACTPGRSKMRWARPRERPSSTGGAS